MFGKMSNHDERIEQEQSKPAAVLFYVQSFLVIAGLVAKLICGLPIKVFLLEIITLSIAVSYVLIAKAIKRILVMPKGDAALTEINNRILSRAYFAEMLLLVVGELVFIFVLEEYFWWVLFYMAAWFIPAVIFMVLTLKNGWMTTGEGKSKESFNKNFGTRVVISSLLFGIITNVETIFIDGVFQPDCIIRIIGMGASWGVLFYGLMYAFIKWSEKNADKRVKQAEETDDEE